MRLHKITAQQYLDILSAGGDAYAATMEISGFLEKDLLGRPELDKRHAPRNWEYWASVRGQFKYFYTVVE